MNAASPRQPRSLLLPDGRLNLGRPEGASFKFDLNHKLLRLSWRGFFFVFSVAYLFLNLVFGVSFAALGPNALRGLPAVQGFDYLLECFFFSVHTFATVGYGNVYPVSRMANVLVTCETLVSFFFVAIGTGLVFSRFARPMARVLFSRVAVVNTQDGQPVLRFRIANERLNQVNEARVHVIMIRTVKTQEGEVFRRQYDLRLQRHETPIFALTWTVIHPIDEQSPLKGLTEQEIRDGDIQIMVHFRGVDETLSQTIYARHVYSADSILRQRVFVDVVRQDRHGRLTVDLKHLHDTADFSSISP